MGGSCFCLAWAKGNMDRKLIQISFMYRSQYCHRGKWTGAYGEHKPCMHAWPSRLVHPPTGMDAHTIKNQSSVVNLGMSTIHASICGHLHYPCTHLPCLFVTPCGMSARPFNNVSTRTAQSVSGVCEGLTPTAMPGVHVVLPHTVPILSPCLQTAAGARSRPVKP